LTVESDGLFQTEFYTTRAIEIFAISATSPEGENTTVTQSIKVKDSTFFMVALGEEQLGVPFPEREC